MVMEFAVETPPRLMTPTGLPGRSFFMFFMPIFLNLSGRKHLFQGSRDLSFPYAITIINNNLNNNKEKKP